MDAFYIQEAMFSIELCFENTVLNVFLFILHRDGLTVWLK